MKRFLYLFQVAHDLPSRLEQAVAAESDVIFLSYRAPSSDPRAIYYPNSTWTEGRNRLLRAALDRSYQYFIFCDGDVELEFTRRRPAGSPWRAFEQFLRTHEPAVGTPAYGWHLSGRAHPTRAVETLRFFDPVFNAFHREALLTLLPYCDLLEREAWEYSGSIVCSIAADLYPGHVLQSNEVRVINHESQRVFGELLLTKPETLYLQSVRDPAASARFRRQPLWRQLAHPDMGEPRPKPATYHVPDAELARRYRLDHPLWVRKRELLDVPLDSTGSGVPATPEAGAPLLVRMWRATLPLRRPLGLVRERRLALLDRLQRLRAGLRRGLRRADLRARWQDWARHPDRVLELDTMTLLALLGYALDRIADTHVVFLEVGTEASVLGPLYDGSVLGKPVVSIGMDRVQVRPLCVHTGYLLGSVTPGPFGLDSILHQYGLAQRTLHYLRITEGDALAAFATLGELRHQCLFVTVRGKFECAGFRLLDRTDHSTFVNEQLLRSLLPELLS